MGAYITKRLLGIAINLVLVSIFLFFALRLIPGDLSVIILTDTSTAEQRQQFKEKHGLDKSPVEQYFRWAGNVLQGDLGKSFRSGISISTEFVRRIPVTLEILVLSFTFTSIIGVTAGIYAAINQNHFWDFALRGVAIFGVSIPNFLLLTLLLLIPARFFSYAPPFGAVQFFDDPVANLQLFVPPTLMLSIAGSAFLIRLTRTSMLDVLRQDYLRTARAKGLNERVVILRHALRNALPTIVTFMGLQVGFLLTGSIILESIMSLPGLGTWALPAIQSKDFPVFMAFALYAAGMLMLITLVVDISYAYLDPRIRYS